MKKIVYFIPAILCTLFYGGIAIFIGLFASPFVYVWNVLFFIGGILLSLGKFWGGFFGMLPGIHLMYMSTKDTGQIFSEFPIGLIITIFFAVCCVFLFFKKKQTTS